MRTLAILLCCLAVGCGQSSQADSKATVDIAVKSEKQSKDQEFVTAFKELTSLCRAELKKQLVELDDESAEKLSNSISATFDKFPETSLSQNNVLIRKTMVVVMACFSGMSIQITHVQSNVPTLEERKQAQVRVDQYLIEIRENLDQIEDLLK